MSSAGDDERACFSTWGLDGMLQAVAGNRRRFTREVPYPSDSGQSPTGIAEWRNTNEVACQEFASFPRFRGWPHSSRVCGDAAVSYTHLRAHETRHDLVCRLLLE